MVERKGIREREREREREGWREREGGKAGEGGRGMHNMLLTWANLVPARRRVGANAVGFHVRHKLFWYFSESLTSL